MIMKKSKSNKKIMKVHLFACGYEDLHKPKTDSSTCCHEAIYHVISTANVMKWQVETLDFTYAFL